MKKLLLLLFIATSPFTISHIKAQQKNITSQTASAAKGYTVLNADEKVKIYKYVHGAHSPKEADKYGPKYFFTNESNNVLTALTIDNLKKAFPTNHPFHDALDANFKQDAELINYDNFQKCIK